MMKLVLFNNTSADLRQFGIEAVLIACLKAGNTVLPEEIADLFTLKIIEENGVRKGIVNFV